MMGIAVDSASATRAGAGSPRGTGACSAPGGFDAAMTDAISTLVGGSVLGSSALGSPVLGSSVLGSPIQGAVEESAVALVLPPELSPEAEVELAPSDASPESANSMVDQPLFVTVASPEFATPVPVTTNDPAAIIHAAGPAEMLDTVPLPDVTAPQGGDSSTTTETEGADPFSYGVASTGPLAAPPLSTPPLIAPSPIARSTVAPSPVAPSTITPDASAPAPVPPRDSTTPGSPLSTKVVDASANPVVTDARTSSVPEATGPHGTASTSSTLAPQPVATVVPAPLAAVAAQPTPPASPQTLTTQVAAPLFTLSAAAPGEHVMTISVTPDNLGPVTVRAHVTGDGIRVELFAPGDAGRDALRAIMPELRRDLAGSGMNASLDLSSQNQPTGDGSPRREASARESPNIDRPAAADPSATEPEPRGTRHIHADGATSTIDILA